MRGCERRWYKSCFAFWDGMGEWVKKEDNDEIRDLTELLLDQLETIIEDINDLAGLLSERPEDLIQPSEPPQKIESGEDENP